VRPHARCSFQSAALAQLFLSFLVFACLLWPAVPATANDGGHTDALPRALSAQDGALTSFPFLSPVFAFPFSLRFLSTFFHPSSVPPSRSGGGRC